MEQELAESTAHTDNVNEIQQQADHEMLHQQQELQQQQQQPQHAAQLACLYTKQKTQKHKSWLDGRLVVSETGVALHKADPPPGSGDLILDQAELTRHEADTLLFGQRRNLELEMHLIMIEGPWIGVTSAASSLEVAPLVSTAMHKVMKRKFRNPVTVAPPPQLIRSAPQIKRRRPLQPGELVRRYYGPNRNENQLNQQSPVYHNEPPLPLPSSDISQYQCNPRTSQHSSLTGISKPQGSFGNNHATQKQWRDPPEQHASRLHGADSSDYNCPTQQPAHYCHSVPTHHFYEPPSHSPPITDEPTIRSGPNQKPNCNAPAMRFVPPPIYPNRFDLRAPPTGIHPPPPYQNHPPPTFAPCLGNTASGRIQHHQHQRLFAVNNGFNASSFYGEDFDDEEEVDPPEVFALHSKQQAVAVKATCSKNNFRDTRSVAQNKDAGGMPQKKSTTSALSSMQLLDLFDVRPIIMTDHVDEFVLPPQDCSSDEQST